MDISGECEMVRVSLVGFLRALVAARCSLCLRAFLVRRADDLFTFAGSLLSVVAVRFCLLVTDVRWVCGCLCDPLCICWMLAALPLGYYGLVAMLVTR